MTDWLAKLPPDDKKKMLNTVKYTYTHQVFLLPGKKGTVLHVAAKGAQLAVAKLLLEEGAGIAHTDIYG